MGISTAGSSSSGSAAQPPFALQRLPLIRPFQHPDGGRDHHHRLERLVKDSTANGTSAATFELMSGS